MKWNLREAEIGECFEEKNRDFAKGQELPILEKWESTTFLQISMKFYKNEMTKKLKSKIFMELIRVWRPRPRAHKYQDSIAPLIIHTSGAEFNIL